MFVSLLLQDRMCSLYCSYRLGCVCFAAATGMDVFFFCYYKEGCLLCCFYRKGCVCFAPHRERSVSQEGMCLLCCTTGICLLCCSYSEGCACFVLSQGYITGRDMLASLLSQGCASFAALIGRDMLALLLLQEGTCLICCPHREGNACFAALIGREMLALPLLQRDMLALLLSEKNVALLLL